MDDILVAYYSRTGYTRTVAGELGAALGADVDPLDDGRDRGGVLGYFHCAREALQRRTIELRPTAHDPSRYGLVVLGTPVWAGNISSPLRSYVAKHKAGLKRVAFFCTQGGSGAEKVFRELAQVCGRSPVATLALNDRDIDKRAIAQQVQRFAAAIKSAAGAGPPAGAQPNVDPSPEKTAAVR